jgi:hypothetical protein
VHVSRERKALASHPLASAHAGAYFWTPPAEFAGFGAELVALGGFLPKKVPMRILVTGDLVTDMNLVRHARSPAHYQDASLPQTLMRARPGGAWYLADLVALACRDLEPTIARPPDELPARRAWLLWSQFSRAKGRKDRVFRVEQFLGCEPAPAGSQPMRREAGEPPDLLVIDDLGLEFRSTPALWPAVLAGGSPPSAIVLKTAEPVAEGELWARLAEYADRLTVVLPVAALRARPARIADSLSWDAAIEDTVGEIEAGLSAHDLGRCARVIVQFGGAGAAVFGRAGSSAAKFQRFVYHPELLERTWQAHQPGSRFGVLSILTAAVVRHLAAPGSFPEFIALGRALAAVRRHHEAGAGTTSFDPDHGHADLGRTLHPESGPEPAGEYYSAFPHAQLADPVLSAQPADHSDLLRDLTGAGLAYPAAKATEVVLRGPAAALAAAPKTRYGHFLTVDREEIEHLNAIRAVILGYLANPADRTPLSLAVFGPPGSGKSFAIKQLAAELFPGSDDAIECNLTGLADPRQLLPVFHQTRDASLLGKVPLVFFDEFDAGGLRWLDAFLAPMQDASFREGEALHRLGKALYVFAGGTCSRFADFDRGRDGAFVELKGPDFISRLRVTLDVKGPNPRQPGETAHLIRRALLLRAQLERHHPGLLDPDSGLAAISTAVVRAFLRVERYLHGARSLETIVKASRPGSFFDPAALPGPGVLGGHVSEDFLARLDEGELELPVIEALAEACHVGWARLREAAGWRHGEPRDDARKLHPLLRPWSDLTAAERELNFQPARLAQAKLDQVGYRIARLRPGEADGPVQGFTPAEREFLVRIEHDIWLRDRLLRGYAFAPVTDERLRLHRDVAAFEAIPEEDRKLDEAIVDAIPETLHRRRFRLERIA